VRLFIGTVAHVVKTDFFPVGHRSQDYLDIVKYLFVFGTVFRQGITALDMFAGKISDFLYQFFTLIVWNAF
jgi:hypothetical protein